MCESGNQQPVTAAAEQKNSNSRSTDKLPPQGLERRAHIRPRSRGVTRARLEPSGGVNPRNRERRVRDTRAVFELRYCSKLESWLCGGGESCRRDGGAEDRARVRHGGRAAREQAQGCHEQRKVAAGQDSEGTQLRRASNTSSPPRPTPRGNLAAQRLNLN